MRFAKIATLDLFRPKITFKSSCKVIVAEVTCPKPICDKNPNDKNIKKLLFDLYFTKMILETVRPIIYVFCQVDDVVCKTYRYLLNSQFLCY